VAGGPRGKRMQGCVAELRSAGQTKRPPYLSCAGSRNALVRCELASRTGVCAPHGRLIVVDPSSASKEQTRTWGTRKFSVLARKFKNWCEICALAHKRA
jgi:hypothetical protein